ncbi:MAG: hypothetical protein CMK59_01810 [Proteobacteria bacterium]|nr:hypothetical protein [Pseudomonadota bacterium]
MQQSNQALLQCAFKLLDPSDEDFHVEDLPLIQRTPLEKEIYHETCECIQKMIQIAITQWLYKKGGWKNHSGNIFIHLPPLNYSDFSVTVIVDYYKNQRLILPKTSDWKKLLNGDVLLLHYLYLLVRAREQYIPSSLSKTTQKLNQTTLRNALLKDPLSVLEHMVVTEYNHSNTSESPEHLALNVVFQTKNLSSFLSWIVDSWSWIPHKKLNYATYLNIMNNQVLKRWSQYCIDNSYVELLAPMFKLFAHLFKNEDIFHQILIEIDSSEIVFETRLILRRQLATDLNSFHFLEDKQHNAQRKLPFDRTESDIKYIHFCQQHHFPESIDRKNQFVNMLLGIIE